MLDKICTACLQTLIIYAGTSRPTSRSRNGRQSSKPSSRWSGLSSWPATWRFRQQIGCWVVALLHRAWSVHGPLCSTYPFPRTEEHDPSSSSSFGSSTACRSRQRSALRWPASCPILLWSRRSPPRQRFFSQTSRWRACPSLRRFSLNLGPISPSGNGSRSVRTSRPVWGRFPSDAPWRWLPPKISSTTSRSESTRGTGNSCWVRSTEPSSASTSRWISEGAFRTCHTSTVSSSEFFNLDSWRSGEKTWWCSLTPSLMLPEIFLFSTIP